MFTKFASFSLYNEKNNLKHEIQRNVVSVVKKKIQPSLEGCGVTAVFHVNLLVLRCVTSSREDFPYHNGRYRSQTKF